mmetsp:Transcript_17178/g.16625  ORF Transcript_17178/g.16625 Transcript_17178/m.16625 type:complete len:523 (-) Transcript_17178:162-1730(-)
MEEFAPTLIHITCPDCTGLHVIEYARTKELPLMGTYHSNIPDYFDHYPGMAWLKPILWGFFKQSYNFMQRLYVPTPFIQKNLVEQQELDRLTDIGVWGRGVDLCKFSPRYRSSIFRQKLGIQDNIPVILFVGRLVPEKRPDIFANVIKRLHRQQVAYHAIVVGAGASEHLVENLPNTTCLGWLDGEKLSEAYASSDIFLFPSSVETFGNVTLEAAASGLPLVVESGCSGHLVKEGLNGFGCEAGDENSFYGATLRLCLDQQIRESFSNESIAVGESMEQRRISRIMINNYHDVTKEFYTKYLGHHGERDTAYTKEGSFIAGTEPRPIGFGYVEYLFVKATRLLFVSYFFYQWCQDVIRLTFFLRRDQQSLVQFEDSSATDDDELDSLESADGIELFEVQVSNLERSLQRTKVAPVPIKVHRDADVEEPKSCLIMVGDSDCTVSSCHHAFIFVMLSVRFATAVRSCLFWSCRFGRFRKTSAKQTKREQYVDEDSEDSGLVSRESMKLERRSNRQKSVSTLDCV